MICLLGNKVYHDGTIILTIENSMEEQDSFLTWIEAMLEVYYEDIVDNPDIKCMIGILANM